ncbi:hypothetical protein [Henriciella litoralis]|uniref:hypothetical protein n=1 Tax=Henriciella litoralis TaxID=568102 RepID=UPI0009FCA638|nr:hypothetical protein [Henriciella litoralis]
MSSTSLRTGSIAKESLANAQAVILPTLPGLLLFAAAVAGQSWINRLATQGGQTVFYWMAMGTVTIFVGCFWSATMYRHLLPEAGTRSVMADAIRLFLANTAVYGLFFIIGFLLTLFFSLFSGVLIAASGYDPSETGSPDEVWRSVEALSDSGGAMVLYALLIIAVCALVWLGLRLFLFGVASIAERHLTIFRSWPWTAKHVARIALLWVSLQLVPWLILSLVASGVLHAGGFDTVFSFYVGPQPDGSAASDLTFALLSAISTLLFAPFYWVGHGLAVALYRRLAPNRVDAETTFG